MTYPTPLHRSAVLSLPDRQHRFSLGRCWDHDLGRVTWWLLNPSTADAAIDDMTVTKCCTYAHRWGYGSVEIVNLFSWRSSKPEALRRCPMPVHPDNDGYVRRAMAGAQVVVAGWGGAIRKACLTVEAAGEVEEWAQSLAEEVDVELLCLGVTQQGHPRHPSRLGYEEPVHRWRDALRFAEPVAITP